MPSETRPRAPGRDLAAAPSDADLPPYVAEIVRIVADGGETSRKYASARGISITSASERFRQVRQRGWIVLAHGSYLARREIRYVPAP